MADTVKSRFKQLLVVFYARPADILTVDNLLRFPNLKSARRETINRYLLKAVKASFIERVHLSEGQSGYRAKDPERLIAYINGQTMTDWTKLPLKPTQPFIVADYHRIEYDVSLIESELLIARQNGTFKPNERTGGSLVLTQQTFSMVVNARSGKGQAWLRLGWDIVIARLFGQRLRADLAKQVELRTGRRHISLPLEVSGRNILIGGSKILVAGSHYAVELDVQGQENDDLVVKAVEMTTDYIKFNRVLLGIEESLVSYRYSHKSLETAVVRLSEGFQELARSQSDLNIKFATLLGQINPPASISSDAKSKPGGELIGYG